MSSRCLPSSGTGSEMRLGQAHPPGNIPRIPGSRALENTWEGLEKPR